MRDGYWIRDEAGRILACECVHDCRECSVSGHEWHVHAGEECRLHPEVTVS